MYTVEYTKSYPDKIRIENVIGKHNFKQIMKYDLHKIFRTLYFWPGTII